MSFSALRNVSSETWAAVLRGEPQEVARWLDAAARYGLVEAQTLLGQVLLEGRGLPKNAKSALQWFGIAADAGYPPAMNMVGRCHELGWGTSADLAKAAGWYRRSAEASYDWGQYNLANLLLRGRGLPRDPLEARAWYLRAANQGHAKSMNMLGRFVEEGWEHPAEPMTAVAWYQRAAEGGDYRGQYNLATCLLREGRINEAASWFRRAVSIATPDVLRAVAVALRDASEAPLKEAGQAAVARLGAADEQAGTA
jgi:TPR repeat protein